MRKKVYRFVAVKAVRCEHALYSSTNEISRSLFTNLRGVSLQFLQMFLYIFRLLVLVHGHGLYFTTGCRVAASADLRSQPETIRGNHKIVAIVLMCSAPLFAEAQVPADAELLLMKYASQEMPVPRRAIVIGNGNYQHANKIDNARSDAVAVRDALNKLGFTVVDYYDLKRVETINAIDKFSSTLTEGDIALIYFAGHGIQVDGSNFIVPTDALNDDVERLRVDNVPVEFIMRRAFKNGTGSALTIVILDACRTNPFSAQRQGARSLGQTPEKGLVGIKAPIGVLIAFATAPGQIAWSGSPTDQNSIYTSSLIKHMHGEGVSVETVFKYVRAAVFTASGMAQEPWESSSLLGDFMFNPTQADLANQAETWRRALVYAGRPGVETYLRLYPASPYTHNARRYLEDNPVNATAPETPIGRKLSGTVRLSPLQLGAAGSQSAFATVMHMQLPIYSGPKTSAEYLGGIEFGDTVRIVEKPNDDYWARVEVPGKGIRGFIPGVVAAEYGLIEKSSTKVRFNEESAVLTAAQISQLQQQIATIKASLNDETYVSIDVGNEMKDVRSQRLAFERALELKERLVKSGLGRERLFIDSRQAMLQSDGSSLIGLSVLRKN